MSKIKRSMFRFVEQALADLPPLVLALSYHFYFKRMHSSKKVAISFMMLYNLRVYLMLRVCGDATEIIAGLPGPFDCVFFDADRSSAPAQLALLMPKLTADVLILADNVFSHPNEIAAYLKALEALPHFDRVIVPTGKGLSVAYRSAAD